MSINQKPHTVFCWIATAFLCLIVFACLAGDMQNLVGLDGYVGREITEATINSTILPRISWLINPLYTPASGGIATLYYYYYGTVSGSDTFHADRPFYKAGYCCCLDDSFNAAPINYSVLLWSGRFYRPIIILPDSTNE